MRARNLKPGFFKNEQLAEMPVECRLLFAGLWCLADREGFLEDRPKRIKMELFPGDSFDVEPLLRHLHEGGLILRYQAQGMRCIQVLNFLKHQNPHHREGPSTLPKPEASPGLNTVGNPPTPQASPGLAVGTPPLARGVSRADSLNPDSLNPDSLNPDSLNPESPFTPIRVGCGEGQLSDHETRACFQRCKAAFPPFPAVKWIETEKAARSIVTNGIDNWETIEAGVKRYAAYCQATGRAVTNPARWFSDIDGKPWRDAWDIPATKAKTTPFKLRSIEELEAEERARAGN